MSKIPNQPGSRCHCTNANGNHAPLRREPRYGHATAIRFDARIRSLLLRHLVNGHWPCRRTGARAPSAAVWSASGHTQRTHRGSAVDAGRGTAASMVDWSSARSFGPFRPSSCVKAPRPERLGGCGSRGSSGGGGLSIHAGLSGQRFSEQSAKTGGHGVRALVLLLLSLPSCRSFGAAPPKTKPTDVPAWTQAQIHTHTRRGTVAPKKKNPLAGV